MPKPDEAHRKKILMVRLGQYGHINQVVPPHNLRGISTVYIIYIAPELT